MKKMVLLAGIASCLYGTACSHRGFQGDAKLQDFGPLSSRPRYVITMPTVESGSHSFKLSSMPAISPGTLVLKLDLSKIDTSKASGMLDTYLKTLPIDISLQLVDEAGRTISDASGSMSTWIMQVNASSTPMEFALWQESTRNLDIRRNITYKCLVEVNPKDGAPQVGFTPIN